MTRSLFALAVSLLAALIYPTGITYVALPLVMLMYNASLSTCLWLALFSGLLVDAIELSPRLGFLGLSYVLTCRILYPVRLYFFKDSFITFPVMTLLFSFILQAVILLVALFFDLTVPKMDFVSPFVDALFGTCVFVLPTLFWDQYRLRQRRKRYSDDT